MKKIAQPPQRDSNPSTLKSRRRNLQLNAVARRIMNDPRANWSSVGTAFISALFPTKIDAVNMQEKDVRAELRLVLQGMLDNLSKGKSSGVAVDLDEVFELAPRKRRGKESVLRA